MVRPGVEIATDTSGTSGTRKLTRFKAFHGSIEIDAATAKVRLIQVADEIVSVLRSDPKSSVTLTVEIHAEFPDGTPDHIRRAVSENANALGFKAKVWE